MQTQLNGGKRAFSANDAAASEHRWGWGGRRGTRRRGPHLLALTKTNSKRTDAEKVKVIKLLEKIEETVQDLEPEKGCLNLTPRT